MQSVVSFKLVSFGGSYTFHDITDLCLSDKAAMAALPNACLTLGFLQWTVLICSYML